MPWHSITGAIDAQAATSVTIHSAVAIAAVACPIRQYQKRITRITLLCCPLPERDAGHGAGGTGIIGPANSNPAERTRCGVTTIASSP